MEFESSPRLRIDRAEIGPFGPHRLALRLTGEWHGDGAPPPRPLLAVIEGEHVHRFPPVPQLRRTGAPPQEWAMSFAVPKRLQPRLAGGAWLEIGGVSLPVPAPAREQPAGDPELRSVPSERAVPEPGHASESVHASESGHAPEPIHPPEPVAPVAVRPGTARPETAEPDVLEQARELLARARELSAVLADA